MLRLARCVWCWLVLLCSAAAPALAQFGQLPPGQLSTHALDGVRAEVAVTFLIDSAAVAGDVPRGLRLLTLQHLAATDSATAALIAAQPALRTAVPSILGFALLDSLSIDHRAAMRSTTAFWWIPVDVTDTLAEHNPGAAYVSLGLWSPESAYVRQVQSHWPHARITPVSIAQQADGSWQLALTLPDARILGTCRPSAQRYPASYPLPAYGTTWTLGPTASTFTTYTYHGHSSRQCEARWTTTGSHPLALALRAYRDGPWRSTTIEDRWHARAGLYRLPVTGRP